MNRIIKVTAAELAMLCEITIDMTIMLAEEAEHDEHRPKRELLLEILHRILGDRV